MKNNIYLFFSLVGILLLTIINITISTSNNIRKSRLIKEQAATIEALHKQSEDRRKLYPKIIILERLVTPKMTKQLNKLIEEYKVWIEISESDE